MLRSDLKICILGPAYPYRGGIAAFNERLATTLQASGHQVTMVTFTLQYPAFLFPGKTQFSSGTAPTGLTIYRKVNTINPLTWLSTARWIRKQEFDLIISRFWLPVVCFSMAFILRKACKHTSTINLAIIDNIIPHEKRPGDTFFTKYFIKSISAGLTLSQKVLEKSRSMFPSFPFHYSPHPVYDIYGSIVSRSTAIEKLKLDKSKKYVLFFGYIRDYKGLDLLIEAFHMMHDAHPNVNLLVAGEFYGGSESYLKLIEDLNLKDRVILHTYFISDQEVKYYFGASGLVSQTYKSASQSGISQIAIHFEKPMICTNVGGLPEVVTDGINGLVVPADAGEVAKGLDKYFKDPNDYFDPEEIKKLKQSYSWDAFGDKVIDIYEQQKAIKT